MKLVRMTIAFILVTAFTLAAQPKLVVSNELIELGTIYSGMSKPAEIKLTNTGKDVLKISNVQSSCGCTTVKQPKAELAPGESDIIKVEFNSSGFRGPATKYVYISSNDPEKPQTNIKLTAEIKEELQPVAQSNVLWLGSVQLGKSVTETISFRNISGKQITVTGIATKNEGISVSYAPKKLKPSEEVKLTVTAGPKAEGYMNEEIYIETDSKNQPRVPLRVNLMGVKSH